MGNPTPEDLSTTDPKGTDDHQQADRMRQFMELYTQHHSRLKYYLMALAPTSHDADDILQETSLVLWKRFDTYELGTNFAAWAFEIARRQAMSHYQRSGRVPRLFEPEVLDLLSRDAEAAASRREIELDVLENCIAKLSEQDRTLIRRRYEPDSSVISLASDIGRNPNSVSKSLGRIRQALLECVERRLPPEWNY